MSKFPNYIQAESKDCGPTCLKSIAKHYGKNLSIPQIRQISETTREGSNLLNLSDASEAIGFRSLGVKLTLRRVKQSTFTMCFTLE